MPSSPKAHRSWCDHRLEQIVTPEAAAERAAHDEADQRAKRAGYSGVNVYSGTCHRCQTPVAALAGGFLREHRSTQVFHLDPAFCAGELERLRQLRAVRLPPPAPAPAAAAAALEPTQAEQLDRAALLELD